MAVRTGVEVVLVPLLARWYSLSLSLNWNGSLDLFISSSVLGLGWDLLKVGLWDGGSMVA